MDIADFCLRRSRGNLTTEIHLVADALGRSLRVVRITGQARDALLAPALLAPALLADLQANHVFAGNNCDSAHTRQCIANMEVVAVIPCQARRKPQSPYDVEIFKAGNRIERCFNKLKDFCFIATRCENRIIYSRGFPHVA